MGALPLYFKFLQGFQTVQDATQKFPTARNVQDFGSDNFSQVKLHSAEPDQVLYNSIQAAPCLNIHTKYERLQIWHCNSYGQDVSPGQPSMFLIQPKARVLLTYN